MTAVDGVHFGVHDGLNLDWEFHILSTDHGQLRAHAMFHAQQGHYIQFP
jgi:hypothetical protein